MMYIYWLKMQFLLCQLPLLNSLDTGGSLFPFLHISEAAAYILPLYLLHTDHASVWSCLWGIIDFLILSSAPKENVKTMSIQYKSLCLVYWMQTAFFLVPIQYNDWNFLIWCFKLRKKYKQDCTFKLNFH